MKLRHPAATEQQKTLEYIMVYGTYAHSEIDPYWAMMGANCWALGTGWYCAWTTEAYFSLDTN